ncbi:MAG: hypothetical protein EZS28_012159, partial [Streblomastix strix]
SRDLRSVDKLFIGAGKALIIIANGQSQFHFYPYKWFNELAMTNGANWFLPRSNINIFPSSPSVIMSPSAQSMSSHNTSQFNVDQDIQSLTSQPSEDMDMSTKSDLDDVQLKIGSSMLFIVSASNSSMIVDMGTGAFFEFPGQQSDTKELGEGGPEDFQYYPMCINNVEQLPQQSFSPHHSIEDRFILGVGNGRTGALHQLSVGNKLQMIMQGKWYEDPPVLFTTKAYSGAPIHALLLVEEEISQQIEDDEKIDQSKDKDKLKDKERDGNKKEIQKRQPHKPQVYSSTFIVGDINIERSYQSQVFALHEDVVEPIDSFSVGIDSSRKTLALEAANGAFVQITTQEARIIPTVRYSLNQTDQTQQQQKQQQKQIQPNIVKQNSQLQNIKESYDDKGQQIKSEFIGYDVKHGLSWPAPLLLSQEQCQQRLQNTQRFRSNSVDVTQRVIFSCGCVTDKLIALSYKCVVFVLIWNPSKPKISSNTVGPSSSP